MQLVVGPRVCVHLSVSCGTVRPYLADAVHAVVGPLRHKKIALDARYVMNGPLDVEIVHPQALELKRALLRTLFSNDA